MSIGQPQTAPRYTIRGRPVPSTTQVIRAFVPHWKCDEFYLERGSVIHRAIHQSLNGGVNWEQWEHDLRSVLPEKDCLAIIGRSRAALRFLSENSIIVRLTEVRLESSLYRFGGTADGIGVYKNKDILWDWKGSLTPEVGLQLAAYRLLAKLSKAGAVAVELHDDCSYKQVWFTPKELDHAQREFLALRSAFAVQEKYGKLNKEATR